MELYFWYGPTFLTPNIHQTGPFAVETCDWSSAHEKNSLVPSWMCILIRKWLLTPTCIHVRIYICMRVYFICFSHAYDIHTHSFILICMHAWMYGSMNLWIYASKYLHIHICVCMCVCIYLSIHVSVYVSMYESVHVSVQYIQACMHVHIFYHASHMRMIFITYIK